jgi:hypothetical protein
MWWEIRYFVCLLGAQKYLATANNFTVARIESRLDKDFADFVFFHVKAVKFNVEQAMKAQRHNSTLPLMSALDVGGWLTPRPGRFNTGKETRYWRLGGNSSWCGQERKISSPPGFEPRTVQLVASRYTD